MNFFIARSLSINIVNAVKIAHRLSDDYEFEMRHLFLSHQGRSNAFLKFSANYKVKM